MAQHTAIHSKRASMRRGEKGGNMAAFWDASEKRFVRTMHVGSAGQALTMFAALFALTFSKLPGGLCPFAPAAFTASLLHTASAPFAFLGCLISTALGFSTQNYIQWWQLSACAAIWLTVSCWRKREGVLLWAMVACGTACVLPAPILGFQSISQSLVSLANASVSVVMVPVFERVLLLMNNADRQVYADDRLCILLAGCALITGLWAMGPTGQILCCLGSGVVIGLCGRTNAPDRALIFAAVCGSVLYVNGGHVQLPMLFGGAVACALPVLRESSRKWLLIPGTILGGLIAGGVSVEMLWTLPVIGGALTAFSLRESRVSALARLIGGEKQQTSGQSSAVSVRTAITLRIWAGYMKGMANAVPKLACDLEDTTQAEYLAQCLCEDCVRKNECWNDRFEITRRYMFKLLEASDEAEPQAVIDQARVLGCVNTEKLQQILLKRRCQNALKKEEEARCQERRTLNAIQIQGTADVLDSLAQRFDAQIKPDDAAFRRAQDEITRREIDAKVVYAVFVKGRKEIMMIRRKNATVEELQRVADIACGMPMQPSAYETLTQTEVLFEQAARLEVNFCAVCQKKEGETVAGDGYIARPLSGGRYLIALSDGMGSGEQAHRESQATLHLLWQCLCAGYTRSQALLAVNGILLSCAGAEMFATMDLCLIDLHTGQAAFEKLGACTSYVIRGGECKAICADTLPMGVLTRVEPRSVRMRLMEDDLLVMVSDGITDYYPDGETGLRRALMKCQNAQPRAICDTILKRTMHVNGNTAQDDMTVLCARIQSSQCMW